MKVVQDISSKQNTVLYTVVKEFWHGNIRLVPGTILEGEIPSHYRGSLVRRIFSTPTAPTTSTDKTVSSEETKKEVKEVKEVKEPKPVTKAVSKGAKAKAALETKKEVKEDKEVKSLEEPVIQSTENSNIDVTDIVK
jgi:hypothetical protein